MSKKSIPVTVRILDKEYKISCPEGEHESLITSAHRVSEDMRKIRDGGKVLGAERIAVMTAINLAHELLNAGDNVSSDISDRLNELQQSIESALKSH